MTQSAHYQSALSKRLNVATAQAGQPTDITNGVVAKGRAALTEAKHHASDQAAMPHRLGDDQPHLDKRDGLNGFETRCANGIGNAGDGALPYSRQDASRSDSNQWSQRKERDMSSSELSRFIESRVGYEGVLSKQGFSDTAQEMSGTRFQTTEELQKLGRSRMRFAAHRRGYSEMTEGFVPGLLTAHTRDPQYVRSAGSAKLSPDRAIKSGSPGDRHDIFCGRVICDAESVGSRCLDSGKATRSIDIRQLDRWLDSFGPASAGLDFDDREPRETVSGLAEAHKFSSRVCPPGDGAHGRWAAAASSGAHKFQRPSSSSSTEPNERRQRSGQLSVAHSLRADGTKGRQGSLTARPPTRSYGVWCRDERSSRSQRYVISEDAASASTVRSSFSRNIERFSWRPKLEFLETCADERSETARTHHGISARDRLIGPKLSATDYVRATQAGTLNRPTRRADIERGLQGSPPGMHASTSTRRPTSMMALEHPPRALDRSFTGRRLVARACWEWSILAQPDEQSAGNAQEQRVWLAPSVSVKPRSEWLSTLKIESLLYGPHSGAAQAAPGAGQTIRNESLATVG